MSRCLAAWWTFALVFLLPHAASAQLLNLPSPFLSGTADTWTGAEGTPHAWSAYSGLNWSPLGKLSHDGLRVRIAGGYGEYRYPARIEGRTQAVYGMSAFGDLLLGYQMGFDRLTLKAFAGATFDGHLLTPFDEASKVNMAATGAKFVVESWLNISPSTWAQLDLSYATAHASYNGRLRLGYRLSQGISVGLEGGGYGNLASDNGRAGTFVRYEWLSGELSVSGGMSGDIAAPRNPYGTMVYLTRF